MKAEVDPQRCQGHTLCAVAAPPTLFELSDIDGHATASIPTFPPISPTLRGRPSAVVPNRRSPSCDTARPHHHHYRTYERAIP